MTDNQNPNLMLEASDSEAQIEVSLRPQNFSEYIGQEKLLENLRIFSKAARKRGEPLDHVLLSGPPGLGKTTLAHILAKEMDTHIFVTSGPALEKKGDLAGILTNLQRGDILFIDEIHRLNASVEENLYPAMEDFKFDVVIGEGAHARSIALDIQPFTLIGATTKTGLLTSPLRDRFGFAARLNFYNPSDLSKIVLRSARIMTTAIDQKSADAISLRSRGTPRIANRLLRRIRDFAQVLHGNQICPDTTANSLDRLGVDLMGLDDIDRRILETLLYTFSGKAVGLDTIAAALGESSGTIEDVYEPYLLQEGFLMRTPRGRIATDKAKKHLHACA